MSDLLSDIHRCHHLYNHIDELNEVELNEFEKLLNSVERRTAAVYAGQHKCSELTGAAFRPRGFLRDAD